MQPNPTPPLNRGQHPVADAWRDHAAELAEWAERTLVVRHDAYGGHNPDGKRTTIHGAPERAVLRRHFAAETAEHVIGLHVASPDELCRTTWVDIDAHGADAPADANLRFARHIHDRSRESGLATRLLDSNGSGGYHVLVVHPAPVPLAESCRLGKWLAREHAEFGFSAPPESFPKRPQLTGKRYEGWVRLPGRHHKRAVWTRVWRAREERWMAGDEAIASLLKLRGRAVDLGALVPGDFSGRRPPRATPAPMHRRNDVSPDHGRDVALAKSALEWLLDDEFDSYDAWLKIGMALRQLGEDGLELWDAWSRPSPKYDPADLASKWESFAPGEEGNPQTVTLGTLFHLAREAGWPGPAAIDEEGPGGVVRRSGRSSRRGSIHIPVRKITR